MHMINKRLDRSEDQATGVSMNIQIGLLEQSVTLVGFAFEVDGLAAWFPLCVSIVNHVEYG
jgi:hypothetical protein